MIESETEKVIKMSFRSKGTFDVNQFAKSYFNGGGHINAAGGILTTWKNENGRLAGNILATSNKLNHKKILKVLQPAT